MGSWRAGCGESRTSGSASGQEKPTIRKDDRALLADSTPGGPSPLPGQGCGWEDLSPVDAVGMGRRTRSSPGTGKPCAWRRDPVCLQHQR